VTEEAERLYERARSLPVEARIAFVEEACRGDPSLRDELASLLDHAEAAEEFFECLGDAIFSPLSVLDREEAREGTTGGSVSELALPSSEPDRMVGRTIGHYRILSHVGRGGMGTVYRAHDTRLDREVALKFLPPHLSAQLDAEERFLAEARAAAALEHPNVCTVYEIGEAGDGQPFIAMASYEGQSLKQRLGRSSLPTEEAVQIAVQVARGLGAAHARGIVHRDVKPGNVMLTADGAVKLLDFGLAKVADVSITRPGTTLGTMAYMAPEQARGDPVDQRTDLWSLGVVLYEMLTGERPFRGGSDRSLLQAILHEDPEPISRRRPGTPEPLVRVVERLLRKNPSERYGSAAELLADLTAPGSPVRSKNDRPSPRAWPPALARAVASRFRAGHLMTAVVAAGLGAVGFWYVGRETNARWLADEALPRIERYLDVADFESAYALAKEIERRDPRRPELAELWPRISWRVTIPSEPPGARVFRQPYGAATDQWEALGRTPLVDIRFPYGLSRLRFELEGHRPLLRALGGAHLNWAELTPTNADMLLVGPETYRVDTERTLPPGMVRVPGGKVAFGSDTAVVRDFMVGRYEVTNAEYKRFVDAGGYRRREFWDPVVVQGEPVTWEAAMRRFADRTGRPGPSTWEAGDYPEGQDAHPVSGVSWYEAAAYARFLGQELPTTHHWQWALANSMFPWLLPASNFGDKGPRPVTDSRAMTHVGAFDMTGNVREWTASAIGAERIILGGGWNDPYYIAGTSDASAPPDDRSPANGFRLASTGDEPAAAARLRAPIASRTTVSAATKLQPVDDAVFGAYGRVFDYQHGPLNASVDRVDRTRLWTRERVQFDAGYGAERMLLYLYLPATGSPPYQTVVYWPGWDAFALDDIDLYFAKQLDFIVKSGRAVAFPIYKGIFERRVGNARQRPDFDTAEYRDNAIDGVKDLRRSIDYLETRPEIDARAIAFFGYSWGGVNGPLALAREPRLRTAVIQVGLLPPMSSTPEVDPVHALPRVRQPTLMLSGEFDPMVPVANAKRYFALLGAPPADKRQVIAIGGHFIPRDLLIREVLDWLDARLGPTNR
jgi:formylglycine-generating enzyme required for sulfatase activity/dienelactone hydrolase